MQKLTRWRFVLVTDAEKRLNVDPLLIRRSLGIQYDRSLFEHGNGDRHTRTVEVELQR